MDLPPFVTGIILGAFAIVTLLIVVVGITCRWDRDDLPGGHRPSRTRQSWAPADGREPGEHIPVFVPQAGKN